MKKVLLTLIALAICAGAFAKIPKTSRVSYSGSFYAGDIAVSGDFYGMNISQSGSFAWDPVACKVRMGNETYLRAALRWTYANVAFKDQITLVDSPAGPVAVPLVVNNFKKSVLHMSYFGLPLGIFWERGKFTMGVQASAEYLAKAYTKYKAPKSKSDINGLNQFRASVEAVASIKNIGVFINYGLTPFMAEGPYTDSKLVMFGVVAGF